MCCLGVAIAATVALKTFFSGLGLLLGPIHGGGGALLPLKGGFSLVVLLLLLMLVPLPLVLLLLPLCYPSLAHPLRCGSIPRRNAGYVRCARAANRIKRTRCGSSMAYKTIGTFLSKAKRKDARG